MERQTTKLALIIMATLAFILILLGLVPVEGNAATPAPGNDTRACVTIHEFDRLHPGMPRAEVRALLDGPGRKITGREVVGVSGPAHGGGGVNKYRQCWGNWHDEGMLVLVEYNKQGRLLYAIGVVL